jgi:short repeat uncharacterized protein predicted to be involved in signal transduction
MSTKLEFARTWSSSDRSFRFTFRHSIAVASVAALLVAGLSAPAQADDAPTPANRTQCVQLMIGGSPAVSRAAEAALVGTDADLSAFLSSGLAAAQDADNRDEHPGTGQGPGDDGR